MIICSIDIMGGKVVQLRQGRDLILTDPRPPAELAAYFARFGPVAVVDLDAALGRGDNRELIESCCRVAPCRVGGGIRSHDDVRNWIKRGARQVVIGTRATPEFLRELPREWIVAALDAKGDDVVVRGWTEQSGCKLVDQAKRIAPHCAEILFTQVQQEGTLGGAAIEQAITLRDAVDVPITVAGGVANSDEVSRLIGEGFSVQLGRALYEGHIDPIDTWIQQVSFDDKGLVATIAQDDRTHSVLMLAYSNADSLKNALTDGCGWYYSRSRGELWRKGATSGHTQRLVAARWDCDRDAVLFEVEQSGPACHLGRDTCFGPRPLSVLSDLERTINQRKSSDATASYTKKLIDNPDLVAKKLREEIEEVIEATEPDHIAWECADVLYHLMARMSAADISFERVTNELRSRFSD